MPDKSRKILLFRLIVISITALMLTAVFITFHTKTTLTFDENYFSNIPSRFYVTKKIPYLTVVGDSEQKNGEHHFIHTGSFIQEFNGKRIKDTSEIKRIISSIPADSIIELTVFNTRNFSSETYQVIKRDIPNDFYRYLTSGVLVVEVIKGGASERGGMRVGDIITRVNKKTFANANQADALMSKLESGNIIVYTLLRENIDFDIFVRLSSFGITFNYLAQLISGLGFIAFGLYLLLGRPQLKAARLTGIAFVLLGFQLANAIDARMLTHSTIITVISYLTNISVILGIAVLMHSSLYFPKERTDLIRKKWVIWSPYVLSGIFIFFIIMVGVFKLFTIRLPFDFNLLFLLFVALKVFIGIKFRKTYSAEQKKLRRPIRIALTIFLSTLVAVTIVTLILSANYTANQYSFFADILNLGVLIVPASYLYTIGRFRLLDLDLKIRRNILYILSSLLWNVAALFLLLCLLLGISTLSFRLPNIHMTGTSIEVLDKPLEPYLRLFYDKFLIGLISVVAVVAFWRIKGKVQAKLDKKFDRIRFDYKRASIEFSDILASNLTLSDLSAGIVKELGDLVKLKRVGILIFRNEEKVCQHSLYGFQSDSLREFVYATGARLIEAIKQFQGEFRVDYLSEPIKEVFKKCDFRYIIPVRSKGKIIATLLIGEKLSEAAFHREDLAFLSSIAGQCSVALENALLYEDLAAQERIKHELDLARRIQLASLPQVFPDIQGLDISGVSLPALEVGGDFFDFLNGNLNELTVIIGDVSGKGTSAALYMSKVQGIIRTLHEFDLSPRKLFIRTNELLYKYLEKSSFISAIGAKMNTQKKVLYLSRAGHLPMLYYQASTGKIERIVPKGLVLGLSKDSMFERNLEEVELRFDTGDVFLFVTDGIIEARNNSHQEYSEERLISTFRRVINQTSEQIRDAIVSSVQMYAGDMNQFDDMTVVVIKICC